MTYKQKNIMLIILVFSLWLIYGCGSNGYTSLNNTPQDVNKFTSGNSVESLSSNSISLLDIPDPSLIASNPSSWFSRLIPSITLELVEPFKIGSIDLALPRSEYWIVWSISNASEDDGYPEVATTKSDQAPLSLPKCKFLPGTHKILATAYNPVDFFLNNPIAHKEIEISTTDCLVNTPVPTITPSPTPTPIPTTTPSSNPNKVKYFETYHSKVNAYIYTKTTVWGNVNSYITSGSDYFVVSGGSIRIPNTNLWVNIKFTFNRNQNELCTYKDGFDSLWENSRSSGAAQSYCDVMTNYNQNGEGYEACVDQEVLWLDSQIKNRNISYKNPEFGNITIPNFKELALEKLPTNPKNGDKFIIWEMDGYEAGGCWEYKRSEIECSRLRGCDIACGSGGCFMRDQDTGELSTITD